MPDRRPFASSQRQAPTRVPGAREGDYRLTPRRPSLTFDMNTVYCRLLRNLSYFLRLLWGSDAPWFGP